jgi:2-phospho-L-lactate guanylyltransferase
MLSAVLSAAQHARSVQHVIVISPHRDRIPADIAVLADRGESLNDALTAGHEVLLERGFREVVILPADLPTVEAADIDALVAAGRRGGFAIAPDKRGTGTNALCLVSARVFRFQFGLDSRMLHCKEAMRMGMSPQVLRLSGLEFDVDMPADLEQLGRQPWLARRA